MKDYIKNIISNTLSSEDNKNRIREYLQQYLLYILYKKKIYKNLIFCGGTALRFLYSIKRFSEDLDFSLSFQAEKYNFETMLETINKQLQEAGYKLQVKYSTKTNVHNAFLKFPELLYEYGITPLKDENLSIKLEIDINPPSGGKEEITLYNNIFMFYIQHYDISSLFAGKLHALLYREYTKGRDWYDLLWYLSKFKGLQPNITLFNNATKQSTGKLGDITLDNWKMILKDKVKLCDIEKIRNDVFRFLDNPEEVALLTKDNFYKLLE